MSIKLIALDMDGTSVMPASKTAPKEYMTEEVLTAIRTAQAKGVEVIFATGRWFHAVEHHFPVVGFKGPQVFCNGAVITNTDGTVLSRTYMPQAASKEIITLIMERQLTMAVCDSASMYRYIAEATQTKASQRWFNRWYEEDSDLFNIPHVAKITVYNSGLWFEELLSERFPELQVAGHYDGYLEVWPKMAGKGLAVAQIAAHYGFTMAEVMGIGDGENDIDLLDRVGLGIAMGQAGPKIKAHAQVIAPTLAENGVAWAINKYVLGQ